MNGLNLINKRVHNFKLIINKFTLVLFHLFYLGTIQDVDHNVNILPSVVQLVNQMQNMSVIINKKINK